MRILKEGAQIHRMSLRHTHTPSPTLCLCLQEVLKEKQNHIEQLLKEKDLERQEADNQATLFQKDINEVGIVRGYSPAHLGFVNCVDARMECLHILCFDAFFWTFSHCCVLFIPTALLRQSIEWTPNLQKISLERMSKGSSSPPIKTPQNGCKSKSLNRLGSLENKSEHSGSSIKGGTAGDSCCGSNVDRSKEIGRWVELVQRRSLRLVDLRREFQGWQGSHERHCILHDVLLTPWLSYTIILHHLYLSIYLSLNTHYHFSWKKREYATNKMRLCFYCLWFCFGLMDMPPPEKMVSKVVMVLEDDL